MNIKRYIYFFYYAQIPALIIILSPVFCYYILELDIFEYLENDLSVVFFSRYKCDMSALKFINGYNAYFYVSSYYFSLILVPIFFMVHIVNIAIYFESVMEFVKKTRSSPLYCYLFFNVFNNVLFNFIKMVTDGA